MILTTPAQREALLARVKSVAMVGASDNPQRASFFVARYLRSHGIQVWPVNPCHSTIDGEPAFKTLGDAVRAHALPDVVDVFRRPDTLVPLVEEAIALRVPAIWFQYGVVNADAIRRGDEAGLTVVVDRCIKIEHARFAGGLSVAGLNSGLVSAKRRPSFH
ncbi:MAG: CoA-binding protein [Candidatus Eremiobacteraeota bacterium]|nr:CoA-binding protein [Candidatus Eremiobacteraeota bacterium]